MPKRPVTSEPRNAADGGGAAQTRAQKILLVEDDEATAFHRERCLSEAGFVVVMARTAGQARVAFSDSRFNLVLSDVRLPDGNGYELCREFRSQRAETPVILISAVYVEDGSRAAATFAGAADFLGEPVSATALIACVRTHVGAASAPRR